MVELREINKNNCGDCFKLKVKDDQNDFVASNILSLAQAWVFYKSARPFAIYKDDIMVGFTMVTVPSEDIQDYYLWRFMIDEKYQKKGYGKDAMNLVMEYFINHGAKEIYLSFEPENLVAKRFYKSFGFVETGKMNSGQLEMVLRIEQ